jgi:hypothetical protein
MLPLRKSEQIIDTLRERLAITQMTFRRCNGNGEINNDGKCRRQIKYASRSQIALPAFLRLSKCELFRSLYTLKSVTGAKKRSEAATRMIRLVRAPRKVRSGGGMMVVFQKR